MEDNLLAKALRAVRQLLIYQPPQEPSRFVLDEAERDQSRPMPHAGLAAQARQLDALLRQGKRLAQAMDKAVRALRRGRALSCRGESGVTWHTLAREQSELAPLPLAYYSGAGVQGARPVSASLDENEKILRDLYTTDVNKDVVIRRFTIPADPPIAALLAYTDGLADKQVVNLAVLQPLMLLAQVRRPLTSEHLVSRIRGQYLPSGQAQVAADFQAVQDAVNSGDTALFFDGCAQALTTETKGWEHRTVDRPRVEQAVRGSQTAFSDVMRVNTALIRSVLRTSDLVTDMYTLGRRSRVKCAVMYLQSVANPTLVEEIKRRIVGVRTDYIADAGVLLQFIEDHPNIVLPQALSTERPDRAAAHLAEGRVVLLVDGSAFAYIVPVSFFTFFHASDDFSLKVPIGAFGRLIRLVGALLSMLLPAMYLAISNFHQEALPTDLVLAIAAAKEQVPFPGLAEVLLMELSFEFIREAGLRVPGVLGGTIGIVGAIILGQAAVMANLVSPIMVVIIAVTGLASYTIAEYTMAFSLRVLRFIFLFLGVSLGLVGIAIGMLVLTVLLCSMKSFGMPYLAPVGPRTVAGLDVIVRGQVYRQEERPDALNTQDNVRQPHISRVWRREPPRGGDGT